MRSDVFDSRDLLVRQVEEILLYLGGGVDIYQRQHPHTLARRAPVNPFSERVRDAIQLLPGSVFGLRPLVSCAPIICNRRSVLRDREGRVAGGSRDATQDTA